MAADSPSTDDPRLDEDHVRTVAGGRIRLVGVVHDHPASRYRVHELVDRLQPDVLALETPPLALPLFEQYAAGDGSIPAFGGELSAAIAAAEDARVVGIDGIDGRFVRTLSANLRAERASLSTIRSLADGVTSVLQHATICRFAASVASLTGLRLEVDEPVDHECSLRDPPTVQAEDERSQFTQSLSFLRVADPPAPVRLRDETREECMAERLRTLPDGDSVVAVVGRGHLDPLAELLDGA
ncbi:hypothetical protein [Halorientalis salina]|uniref:hypothetical protein n=1 Tax=Halorientalis salina TaxID=2932266 RepID=UPI0010ABAE76|nr:hypothetical protein [Halorientalis salina]